MMPAEPLQPAIVRGALSEHEPMNRMKGMHGVCLHPGRSLIELKARLYNRTPLTQTFLWWANVATRVHERYLFPFFTAGALLAAEFVAASAGYLIVGLLNALNLHAILGAPLSVGAAVAGLGRGGGAGAIRGGGSGGLGGFGTQIASIRLPFADLARSEMIVALVALGQTAALVALLVAWCVLVIRPRPIARAAEAPYVAWRPSSTS